MATTTQTSRTVTFKKRARVVGRGSMDASFPTKTDAVRRRRVRDEGSGQRRQKLDAKSLAMMTSRRRVSPSSDEQDEYFEESVTKKKKVHFNLSNNTVAMIDEEEWVPPHVTWHTSEEYRLIKADLVDEIDRLRERLMATTFSGWYDDSMASSISQQESIDNFDDQELLYQHNGEFYDDEDIITNQECTIRGLEVFLQSPEDRDSKMRRRVSLTAAVLRIQTMHERRQARMVALMNRRGGRSDDVAYAKSIADASKLRSLRDRRVAVQAGKVDAEFVRRTLSDSSQSLE